MKGDTWAYKKICEELLSSAKLWATHYSELWLKESWKRWIGMEISHKIKFCYHVSFDDTPWFATVNNSILQF